MSVKYTLLYVLVGLNQNCVSYIIITLLNNIRILTTAEGTVQMPNADDECLIELKLNLTFIHQY